MQKPTEIFMLMPFKDDLTNIYEQFIKRPLEGYKVTRFAITSYWRDSI